jgi:hypothetical protein
VMEQAEKKPKEHWFRKIAEVTPIRYLPSAVTGAVRDVVYGNKSNKDKLSDIRKIIEIQDELFYKEE